MPQATKECMSAVEHFSAQVAYEVMPMALKGMMDKNALKDVCLIDVRSIEAYKQCHISMALCIPLPELAAKMSTLPKDKLIVAYCGDYSCGLAPRACLELAQKGFKVMRLCGGMEAWQEKGLPVDKKA
jgi:rhodanese-related sulfurtransferase